MEFNEFIKAILRCFVGPQVRSLAVHIQLNILHVLVGEFKDSG